MENGSNINCNVMKETNIISYVLIIIYLLIFLIIKTSFFGTGVLNNERSLRIEVLGSVYRKDLKKC